MRRPAAVQPVVERSLREWIAATDAGAAVSIITVHRNQRTSQRFRLQERPDVIPESGIVAGVSTVPLAEPASEVPSSRAWTFLTNHAHVLVWISGNPESRVRDIAANVGITERAAQSILRDLENDGYVSKVRHGRRNSYTIHPELPFRHPIEAAHAVGDLLRLFSN